MGMPLNFKSLFSIRVRAIIQTYKGYSSPVEFTLDSLPKIYSNSFPPKSIVDSTIAEKEI